MSYSIRLPNGKVISGIPDEIPLEEARARILATHPEFAPKAEPKTSFSDDLSDLRTSLDKGVLAIPQALIGLADIPTGGRVGKWLQEQGVDPSAAIKAFDEGYYSEGHKAKQQAFSEAEGVLAKTAQALKNPGLIGQTVVESAPAVLLGGLAARGLRALAPGVSPIVAGGVGEGAVMAGSQAANIRAETPDGLLTPGQSLLAAGTGVVGGLLGVAGGKIAQRLGFPDIDTMLAKSATDPVAKGAVVKAVLGSAVTEGFLEELPQSVQEQVAKNLALNKPLDEGVADAAVLGTLAGAAMGGGAASISAMRTPQAPTAPGQAGQPTPTEAEMQARREALRGKQPEPAPEQVKKDLVELASQPQGWALLEQEKQRVLQALGGRDVKDIDKWAAAVERKNPEMGAYLKDIVKIQRELTMRGIPTPDTGAAQQSAFATNEPDLFGLYTPPQENVAPTPSEYEERPYNPNQEELPFGATEPSQGDLYEDLHPQRAPEDKITPTAVPEEASVVTPQLLDGFGIPARAAIRKRVEGLRLDRTSQLQQFTKELQNYAARYAPPEAKAAIQEYMASPAFMQQKEMKLRTPKPAQPVTMEALAAEETVEVPEVVPTEEVPEPVLQSQRIAEQRATLAQQSKWTPETGLDDAAPVTEAELEAVYQNLNLNEGERKSLTKWATQKIIGKTPVQMRDDPKLHNTTSPLRIKVQEALVKQNEPTANDTQPVARSDRGAKSERGLPEGVGQPTTVGPAKNADTGRRGSGLEAPVPERDAKRVPRKSQTPAVGGLGVPTTTTGRPAERVGQPREALRPTSVPGTPQVPIKAEPQPQKLDPADEWDNYYRTKDTEPKFADLSREERRLWESIVENNEASQKAFDRMAKDHARDKRNEERSERRKELKNKQEDVEYDVDNERLKRLPEALRTENELGGKPIGDAMNWLVDSAPDDQTRLLAQRIRNRIGKYTQAGTKITFEIVNPQSTKTPISVIKELQQNSRGLTKHDFKETAKINIYIRGADLGGVPGATYETILHEFLHAATAASVHFGRGRLGATKLSPPADLKQAVKELDDLTRAIQEHIVMRSTADDLTPFERRLVEQTTNAFADADETIAWGMSSPEAQEFLRGIPTESGKSNFAQKFLEWVRKLFGMPKGSTNMLERVVNASNRLLDISPEATRETATQVNLVAPMRDGVPADDVEFVNRVFPDEEKEGVLQALRGVALGNKTDPSLMTKVRAKAVDKYASVAEKMNELFSQGVRDSFGNVNDMVLLRQAEDNNRLTMALYANGGMELRKDGMGFEVVKRDVAPAQVFKLISDYGKRAGVTYEQARKTIDRALEGHRLYGLRENNRRLEKLAAQLESQGAKGRKAAQSARDSIKKLHLDDETINRLNEIWETSPEMKEITDVMNKVRYEMIDLMAQVGRISQDKAEDWKRVTDYVPFDRIGDDVVIPRGITSSGMVSFGRLPALKGSIERPVTSTVDAYMRSLGWMVSQTTRNHAAKSALQTMSLAGYAQYLGESDVGAENKDLVVAVYSDGTKRFYELQNKYDFLAFKDIGLASGPVIKALQNAARILRTAVTAMPPFAAKQVLEDAQRAMVFSGVDNPWKVAAKTLRNFVLFAPAEWRGKKLPIVEELERLGIVGEFDFSTAIPAESIEEDLGYRKRKLLGSETAGYVLHKLEQITRASDLAARAAVYEQTLQENGDKVTAATRARELINFSRRGSSGTMRVASQVIPFFNAYAQGTDLLFRAATGVDSSTQMEKRQARRFIFSRMAMLMAMGTLYAMAMGDDEDWKNASTEVRDGNWLLPGGLKIPAPKELAFIYKGIPERLVDYFNRSGTEEELSAWGAVKDFFKGMMYAYSPPDAVPSAVRPVVENLTNYSFFSGRELVGPSLKNLEPSAQYTDSTSELAKLIGKTTETSPIKVENILRGYFGLAGGYGLMLTDALINPDRTDRPFYQLPFVSLFAYDTIGGRPKTEFYDLQEKVNRAYNTYNMLVSTGRDDEAEAFYEEKAELIDSAKTFNMVLKELAEIRKEKRMIAADDELSGEEKRELLDELREYENEAVSLTRELAKELGKN